MLTAFTVLQELFSDLDRSTFALLMSPLNTVVMVIFLDYVFPVFAPLSSSLSFSQINCISALCSSPSLVSLPPSYVLFDNIRSALSLFLLRDHKYQPLSGTSLCLFNAFRSPSCFLQHCCTYIEEASINTCQN